MNRIMKIINAIPRFKGQLPNAQFIVAVGINSLGNGVFLSILAVYFVRIVGLNPAGLGLWMSAAAATGVLSAACFGWLSDRLSPKLIFSVLLLGQALVMLLLSFLKIHYLCGAVIIAAGVFESGAASARGALVALLVDPSNRVRFRAQVRSVANGMAALGAGIGGIVLAFNTESVYVAAILGDAGTFIVSSILVGLIATHEVDIEKTISLTHSIASQTTPAFKNHLFLLVSILSSVLVLCESFLTFGIPLWIASCTTIPLWTSSVLLIINTIAVVLLQVKIGAIAVDVSASLRLAKWSGILLTFACILVAPTGFLPALCAQIVLLAVVALQTVAELFQAASGWSFSYEMASENRIGEYQGVFNALQDAGQFASSTVFGFVVGMNNPSGWLMIAVLFFVTGIAFDFIRAHLLIPGTGKAVS